VSVYEPDDRVTEFTAKLSSFARRNYQGGQATHAHLVSALNCGWTPTQLARHCSRDLPTARASAVIQSRLQWCAEHLPPAGPATPAKAVPWCGRCDDELFRWLVDGQGRPLRPCPTCSPQRNQMARPA